MGVRFREYRPGLGTGLMAGVLLLATLSGCREDTPIVPPEPSPSEPSATAEPPPDRPDPPRESPGAATPPAADATAGSGSDASAGEPGARPSADSNPGGGPAGTPGDLDQARDLREASKKAEQAGRTAEAYQKMLDGWTIARASGSAEGKQLADEMLGELGRLGKARNAAFEKNSRGSKINETPLISE